MSQMLRCLLRSLNASCAPFVILSFALSAFSVIMLIVIHLLFYHFLFILDPGFDSTYATTTDGHGSPIPRTGSPLRTGSPTRAISPMRRSMSPGSMECFDVDL